MGNLLAKCSMFNKKKENGKNEFWRCHWRSDDTWRVSIGKSSWGKMRPLQLLVMVFRVLVRHATCVIMVSTWSLASVRARLLRRQLLTDGYQVRHSSLSRRLQPKALSWCVCSLMQLWCLFGQHWRSACSQATPSISHMVSQLLGTTAQVAFLRKISMWSW